MYGDVYFDMMELYGALSLLKCFLIVMKIRSDILPGKDDGLLFKRKASLFIRDAFLFFKDVFHF